MGGQRGRTKSCHINFTDIFHSYIYSPPSSPPDLKRTCGAGRQTLRMPSVPECRPGGYLGSCRAGCMEKCCLLFMVIIILPASNVAPDMKRRGRRTDSPAAPHHQTDELLTLDAPPGFPLPPLLLLFFQSSSSSSPPQLHLCSTYRLRMCGLCAQKSFNRLPLNVVKLHRF